MINEIKHLVHSMSPLPPLVVHFRSCMFFLTKTAELDLFRLGVYESCDFQNRPVGRKLKFSGLCAFRCAFYGFLVVIFQHLMLGAGSEVLDGLPLGSVTLAGFSGTAVFRLTKSQAEHTGTRRKSALASKY